MKALLPVDAFGQPADFDVLMRIAEEHSLAVIEDSCEALGAEYKGRDAGMLGDAGVFGFYPNKQITTGEGGLVVTNRDDWAEMVRSLRNQGRAPGDTWLEHTYLGYNYRLDELSAAMGLVQFSRLDQLLSGRDRVAGWYAERLAEMPEVEMLPIAPTTTRVSWFVYVVRLPGRVDRADAIRRLDAKGIPARPYFSPIHLMPYFVDQFGYQVGDFPIAEDLGWRSLALPFSGVMTEDQVDLTCRELRAVLMA